MLMSFGHRQSRAGQGRAGQGDTVRHGENWHLVASCIEISGTGWIRAEWAVEGVEGMVVH